MIFFFQVNRQFYVLFFVTFFFFFFLQVYNIGKTMVLTVPEGFMVTSDPKDNQVCNSLFLRQDKIRRPG